VNFEIPFNPAALPVCDVCKSAPATIQFVEQRGEEMRRISICQNCAAQQGIQQQGGSITFNLPSLLAAMASVTPNSERIQSLVCPSCGLTSEKFQEVGRLGCSKCFDIFGPLIEQVIKRTQSGTAHKGLAPSNLTPMTKSSEIETLRQKLKEAIASERYEEAARVRDRIKLLEKESEV